MTLLHMKSDYGDSMPRHRYSDPDFFDLAGASYEQQSKLGSLQGMQVMLRDIWVNNINEARKVHPELGDEPVFLRGTIGAYLKEQLDEEPNFWHTVPEFAQDLTEFFGLEPIEKDEHGYTEMFAENLAAMRAYDERLRELKEIAKVQCQISFESDDTWSFEEYVQNESNDLVSKFREKNLPCDFKK